MMGYYLHFGLTFFCLLLFNLCLSSLSAQAMFTTYHRKDGKETKQQDSAYFLRAIHIDALGKDKV
ncbi:hypothetical protein [Sphingobacterium multivorum]|uniref:hypothetical protein n=1 Tax=Sphingobacterium multivorum TaxID=28454 RepID=UPI0031BB28AA